MGLTRIRATQVQNLDYKQAVRVATLDNITLSGGTPVVVDGVTLNLGDRVLVRAQDTAAENGIYTVSVVGSGSNGTWIRSVDTNQTGEVDPGMVVMVTEGDAYADTPWKLVTNGTIIIGTTALEFEQFGGGGSGTPGGANTNIQFNDAGTFAGSNDLTWNGSEFYANGSVLSGNILPTANNVFSLGNATAVWTDLFLSNSTIYLGEATISASGANLLLPNSVHIGNVVLTDNNGMLSMPETMTVDNLIVTANVTADYFIGNSLTVANSITVNSGNLTTAIVNSGSTGVGNIGSAGSTFDTVFAKATSAQYADLAEIYSADQQYPAGTVVIFGGNREITQSLTYADPAVAGVISTDPAYIMNSSAAGQPVALQGRVPCKVVGNIAKGDLITSSSQTPGTATRLDPADWRPGSVIGKALENYNSNDVGIIEVVVGRV
jgi:hypothetical protein